MYSRAIYYPWCYIKLLAVRLVRCSLNSELGKNSIFPSDFFNFETSFRDSLCSLKARMNIFDMDLEIAPSRKGHLAESTPVGRVVGVYVHVKFQIRQLIEGFLAEQTPVRLLARVYEHMVPQIALLVEALAAHLAQKLFLVTVRPKMGLERRGPVECFVTDVALMRLGRGMDDLMSA